MGRIRASAFIFLFAWVGLAPCALAAQTPSTVDWSASINNRDLREVDSNDPLLLSATGPAMISVEVRNDQETALEIERIRLAGRILGLPFYVYTTDVYLTIAPGDSDSLSFSLNLRDLAGQATGNIPSELVLLDANSEAIDSITFPVQIDGSMRSVYGTFGLAVAAMTAFLLVGALWRLARGRLSRHRWRRATAFATPGLGIGFVLTFTLSALTIVVPTPGTWLLFLVLGAAVGFLIGYLTPTPSEPERQDSSPVHARVESPQHAQAVVRQDSDRVAVGGAGLNGNSEHEDPQS